MSEEKNLYGIKIAWYKGHYRVYNSTISVSIDKENYNEVYYGQSSGNTLELKTYLFKEALAGKYVKLGIQGNSENNWASVTESTSSGLLII